MLHIQRWDLCCMLTRGIHDNKSGTVTIVHQSTSLNCGYVLVQWYNVSLLLIWFKLVTLKKKNHLQGFSYCKVNGKTILYFTKYLMSCPVFYRSVLAAKCELNNRKKEEWSWLDYICQVTAWKYQKEIAEIYNPNFIKVGTLCKM